MTATTATTASTQSSQTRGHHRHLRVLPQLRLHPDAGGEKKDELGSGQGTPSIFYRPIRLVVPRPARRCRPVKHLPLAWTRVRRRAAH